MMRITIFFKVKSTFEIYPENIGSMWKEAVSNEFIIKATPCLQLVNVQWKVAWSVCGEGDGDNKLTREGRP